jgi:ABC-type antimicrobial peptide transport system permease subunit
MEEAPWYEIVGVVGDMITAQKEDPKKAAIYHPVSPRDAYPGQVAVRVKGDPDAFVPRLREIATVTDPTLRLYNLEPLDQVNRSEIEFMEFWFRMLLLVSGIALTLSLAGIYAVMAFTVARRTREIGIRVALGASQRRVVAAIFRRPLIHVAIGVLTGAGVILAITLLASGGRINPRILGPFSLYTLFMMAVCMLACIVPTRRALRVEPTEALRADG